MAAVSGHWNLEGRRKHCSRQETGLLFLEHLQQGLSCFLAVSPAGGEGHARAGKATPQPCRVVGVTGPPSQCFRLTRRLLGSAGDTRGVRAPGAVLFLPPCPLPLLSLAEQFKNRGAGNWEGNVKEGQRKRMGAK